MALEQNDIERLKEIFVTRKECDKEMDEVKAVMADNKAQFAVITTKLSLIMWILGAVGSGVVGILINMIFGG